MNRQIILLTALGAVLVLVAFYFLAWAPKSEEVELIETEISNVLSQQTTAEQRIRALEEVRARAPAIEADLAAAEAIVPPDVAFPAALRQLQLAADDSGVTLLSIQPGRPSAVADGSDLSTISLALTLQGSYFQVVDFFRRVEEPSITPRGIVFANVSIAPAEYPVLDVVATGEMFALLPVPAAAEPAPAATPTPTPTEGSEG